MKVFYYLCFLLLINLKVDDKGSSKIDHEQPRQIDIVMLGNSITHGGNWNKLLKRNNIDEQGVESDSLKGFVNRVENVIRLKPKLCFIMGGINDIYKWEDTRDIFTTYKDLIKILVKEEIEPVIQSTLLAGKKYPHSENRNKEVVKLNNMLRKYALIRNIRFIDLNEYLSEDGFLKENVTWDGVHLTKLGYEIWSREIEKVLIEKKL